jgi:predicted PurR-regulated permease PerM
MADEPKPAPAPGSDSGISGVTIFRQRALALGFGAISLLLFVLLVLILRPVTRPVLWAAALAILFYPVHSRVLRITGGRSAFASGITTCLTIATFAVPTVLFILNFVAEAEHLWPEIRSHLRPDTFQLIADWIDRSPIRPYIPWLFQDEPYLGAATVEDKFRDAISSFSSLALGQLGEFGKNVPDTAISAGLIIITLFFFLRFGARWVEQVKSALPLEREHADNLLHIIAGTVNAVFRGVIVTAAVQAILAGLAFVVTNSPAPVVLGGITFIAALIPFVGPVAIWLPVGIFLIASGRTLAGVGLLLWGTFVVSLVDNFLRPFLIGRETRLPVLWLFLALIGGLRTFGFLGLLLGPIVLSLFLACYRIYAEGAEAARARKQAAAAAPTAAPTT